MEKLLVATRDAGIFSFDLFTLASGGKFKDGHTGEGGSGLCTVGRGTCYVANAETVKDVLHVWRWGKQEPCWRATLPEKLCALIFSSDGLLLFGGGFSGHLYVWQCSTGGLRRCWQAHMKRVRAVALTEDECALVSASDDGMVHCYTLFDIFMGSSTPYRTWAGHCMAVTGLCVSVGGLEGFAVSCSSDRTVQVWRYPTSRSCGRWLLPCALSCIALSRGCTPWVFTGGSDGVIYGRSVAALEGGKDESAGGKEKKEFTGHTGCIHSCDVNFDGSRVVSCAVDGVRVWDVTSGLVLHHISHLGAHVTAVKLTAVQDEMSPIPRFAPLHRTVSSLEDEGTVTAYSKDRGRALFVEAARVTPDSSSGGDAELVAKLREEIVTLRRSLRLKDEQRAAVGQATWRLFAKIRRLHKGELLEAKDESVHREKTLRRLKTRRVV